jgi:hypothetical protein
MCAIMHPFPFQVRLIKNLSMKGIKILVLLLGSIGAQAQSKSYQMLKDNFIDQPDVHSFSVSGWMGRTILNLAGEFEFKEAIRELKHIRLMTIPSSEFENRNLTINGFKRVLLQDSYQELAFIRDNGDDVSIYIKEGNNNKNHYFVLVEEEQEVVAIEMKGYIDLQELNSENVRLANSK